MTLEEINARLVECRRCPRLVEWREKVAREKRAAYREEDYWGKPVPGFGDPQASIVLVGLAPAAHGANRTGRMFTGDRSGDWLYAALHRAGLASRPTSSHRGDSLQLFDTYITAAVHCAPPNNKPTVSEQGACSDWLAKELVALSSLRVLVPLGGIAFNRILRLSGELGWGSISPRPRFGHGVEVSFPTGPWLVASYHPSQQNTFTGKLTEKMLDAVLGRAISLAEISP